tara:strand:+ start:17619 stop:18374 length:756 start_codon:yes stop_codon:yes gene_type:complete
MSKSHTLESIRSTLSNYKIPDKHIEVLEFKKGKNPAKYIKWSYALGVFLKHYPEARWEFVQYEQADGTMLDVQIYPDNSCSVECNVWVGDIRMHMWLPVTKGQTMNASLNSFDINTAKMRCLTKCISVCFGLGADVYGMDMLPTEFEGGSEVSTNESPIPKSTSVENPPSTPIEKFVPEPDADFDICTPQPVGYNKGKPYTEYNNDIGKIRYDIKWWKGRKKLTDDQKLHINNLESLEKLIIKAHEEAFKS